MSVRFEAKLFGGTHPVEILERCTDIRSQHGHYRLRLLDGDGQRQAARVFDSARPIGVVDAHASRIFILPNAPERSAT